ncbi:hypothetical protein KR215_003880 [Drosophila sulfurigaster]|nr:hypothetical protein KR215_003880 [Drosophila sulfurigaster]
MTQMSHNPNTKIDMDPTRTVETENDDDDVNVVSFDVHKATSDNELSAHEQTLNLNVAEAETAIAAPETEGVGERKEIEHQQAENFNDAFGRRHHNENDNDNNNNNDNSEKNNADDGDAGEGEGNADDNDDDAMNAIAAKNKREICEQSKLETTAKYELNMTKEQQSICLASEHARQIQTIAYTEQATTAASHNRPSDARGSSSEQVDGQQRQQEINVCQPVVKSNPPITIVTQNASQAASSSPSSLLPSPSSGHPSIEFFECAVRELLEEGASSRVSLIDRDLFDLLSELVQLLATPTNTGLLWSEPLLEQVVSECVDMTVSKVSDDSETTTANVVDIYTEQIEQQPLELDDNQNNNSNNSNQTDMKYEALRSSSRLPESLSSSRLPSTAAATTVTPTATATSRIRDAASTASSRIRDAASGITPATSRIRDVTTPVSSTATSRIRDATGPALSTTSSRIRDTTTPITAAATSRLRDTTPTATSATTSRIRDVPTATTTRPLLSELKRNSTSRDDLSLDPDSVLPERTRLRRQRRMRSQDSVEEKPEDVVERINKLRARISASLSEVKNVIKQYSTESEAEAAGEKWLGPPTTAVTKVETEPVAEQPVQFRFVKKVRRRSYFDEAEEEKEQAKEAEKSDKETVPQCEDNKLTKEKEVNEIKEEKQQDKSKSAGELSKSHDEQQHKEPAEISTPIEPKEKCNKDVSSEAAEPKISQEKQKQTQETVEQKQKNLIEIKHSNKSEKEAQPIAKESTEVIVKGKQNEFIDVKEEKKPKVPTNAEEKKPQTTDCKQAIKVQEEQKQPTIITENQEQEQQPQKALVNGESPTEKSKEKDKVQSKIEFLAKVQSELKAKPKTKELSTIKEQPQETTAEAAATTETTPAITELKAAKTSEEVTATTPVVATSMSTTTSAAPTPIAAPSTAAAATSKQPVEGVEATPQSAALPKESATQPASIEDKKIAASKTETPANVVHKKKTTVKVKNPRRASIAAVEQSKIVPEAVQSDALTQRRPSDSEAIVKRKKKQKLTSSVANATTSGSSNQTAAAATATSSAKTPQLQQQQQTTATATNEQLVTAKVESHESTAKRVTKPTAKSVEGDEQKTAAAITAPAAAATTTATTKAATIPTTAATTTAAEATTAAATTAAASEATAATISAATEAAPKQLPIDVIANKAPTSGSSRRASLKLAELVGETVLVVPASATTQDLSTATTTVATTTIATTTAIATATTTTTTATEAIIGQSKEPINQSEIIIPATATPKQVVVASGDIEVAPVVDVVVVSATPQIAATLSEVRHNDDDVENESSPQKHQHDRKQTEHIQQQQTEQQQQDQEHTQQLVEATKDNAADQTDNSLATMPELKVLTGPVQPVKIETVEQPHDESDLSVVKKKSPHLKKLVRKSSIDKGKEKVPSDPSNNKLSNILKDKNKISNPTDRLAKLTPPKKQTKPKEQSSTTVADTTQEQQENVEIAEQKVENEVEAEAEPEPEPEPVVEPAPKPKKPRQIKKKVIIKRQQRRLSIGDTFFIQQEPEEPKVPEIETIEKAIAYVTDDEEDLEPLPEQESAKPLKSCLHVREYKIGDLILYAERYRKTQVRWKRGRVLERITSISYKLEIEGKEVPAHISYIKKYTGRKVKFVGKEYLDIDYEQVVEEERRARSYSIWNMV